MVTLTSSTIEEDELRRWVKKEWCTEYLLYWCAGRGHQSIGFREPHIYAWAATWCSFVEVWRLFFCFWRFLYLLGAQVSSFRENTINTPSFRARVFILQIERDYKRAIIICKRYLNSSCKFFAIIVKLFDLGADGCSYHIDDELR